MHVSVLFEHRLKIAGYETRALELDGDGPSLILLHGWSDSADTWRGVLDRLRRRGRRAVALDMPGFGSATRLSRDDPVLSQLDRFLRGALTRFGDGDAAIVVGNSLGGCAALRVAEDSELPLAGVVPIAPAGFDMAGWFLAIEGERLIRLLLASPVPVPAPVVRGAVGQVYRQLAFARPSKVDPRVVAAFSGHVSSRDDVARVLSTGRRLRTELNGCFRLERIACPVLVIWGDQDRMVFASGAEQILREVSGSRLEVIEHCGHCPQIEAPDRLTELIHEFSLESSPKMAQ